MINRHPSFWKNHVLTNKDNIIHFRAFTLAKQRDGNEKMMACVFFYRNFPGRQAPGGAVVLCSEFVRLNTRFVRLNALPNRKNEDDFSFVKVNARDLRSKI